MARIWWTSATFNHCLLIVPILAWLVRQRLPELKALAPGAWAPGLALVGAGAAAWLLGEAGSVSLLRHLGLVLMLQGAVIACLGKAVARGLAFPLFYALFLVPFGEELVPPMQKLTAQMSMALLALAGVPAHLEGIFISTPTGLFRVAEACSGSALPRRHGGAGGARRQPLLPLLAAAGLPSSPRRWRSRSPPTGCAPSAPSGSPI